MHRMIAWDGCMGCVLVLEIESSLDDLYIIYIKIHHEVAIRSNKEEYCRDWPVGIQQTTKYLFYSLLTNATLEHTCWNGVRCGNYLILGSHIYPMPLARLGHVILVPSKGILWGKTNKISTPYYAHAMNKHAI